MNSLLVRQYQETKLKYLKFSGRLQRSYKTGEFFRLPGRKQNWLVSRVKKLWEKLKFLEKQLKHAIAVGALTLLLTFSDSTQAQPNFVPAPDQNPLSPPLVHGYSPIVHDVDLDGDVDILTTHGDNNIVFYKNIGTPSLPDFIRVPDNENPFALLESLKIDTRDIYEFADIDGDGDLDLFAEGYNGTSFFANTGTAADPVFEPADNPVGGKFYESLVDIDGDGDLDMVDVGTASYYNQYSQEYVDTAYVKVILNVGTPNYPIMVINSPFYLPVENEPQGVGLNITGDLPVDFGNDGDIDFLVKSRIYSEPENKYYTKYQVIENAGTLQSPFFSYLNADYPFKDFLFDVNDYGYEDKIFPTDLDNDGDIDFLVSDNEIQLTYYRNNKSTLLIDNSLEDLQGVLLNSTYNIAPVFLDLDGDGDFDMYSATDENYKPGIYYENTGNRNNPQFTPSEDYFPFIQTGDSIYFAPLFVDIDNDGDLDCFAVTEEYYSTSNWDFYRNNGTQQSPDYQLDNYNNPLPGLEEIFTQPSFADFDGDGDKDMILIETDFEAYNYWSHISYFRNTIGPEGVTFIENTGSINPFNDIEVEDALDVNPFVIADLDMDGDNDVFYVNEGDYYTNENNSIIFLHNIGTSTSPLFQTDDSENPFKNLKIENLSGFSLVDLDGDGDKDLFCTSFDNRVVNYYINTDPRANSSGSQQFMSQDGFIKVFPNPASNYCILDIDGPVTGICELKVSDIYGRVLKTESFRKVSVQFQHHLDVSSLIPGLYLIDITQDNQRYLTRLIIE